MGLRADGESHGTQERSWVHTFASRTLLTFTDVQRQGMVLREVNHSKTHSGERISVQICLKPGRRVGFTL